MAELPKKVSPYGKPYVNHIMQAMLEIIQFHETNDNRLVNWYWETMLEKTKEVTDEDISVSPN